MKMNVREFRHGMCITQVEAAGVLREYFKGMDKDLLDKVEQPDVYGVELIREAEAVLKAHYRLRPRVGKDGMPRDSSGHKFTERVLVRMPVSMKVQLRGMIREMGYETMQDYLYDLLLEDLDRHRNERMLEELGIEGRMFFDGLD